MKISSLSGCGYLTLYRKYQTMKETYHWSVCTRTMLHCWCKDVSQAECSALCVFDAHRFVVEHQLQGETLCFVILRFFSDVYYMISHIHEYINSDKDNKCIVQWDKCFIVKCLSCFKYNADTLWYFLTYIHCMGWPIQLPIDDNSQEFSFSHLYNTSFLYVDIAHISWAML